jgi:hypothetical protein
VDEDRLTPQLGRLIDAAKAAAGPRLPDEVAVWAQANEVGGTATREAGPACEAAAPRAGTVAAAGEAAPRLEGWALLGADGKVYAASRLATVLDAARVAKTGPEAAAFAVRGDSGDTLLPGGGWRTGADGAPADLPVAVKYLGRWVLVTLGEIPDA